MKKFKRKMLAFLTDEETIGNKILATVFILLSILITVFGKDATVPLILTTIAIPMFFAKDNWTMF